MRNRKSSIYKGVGFDKETGKWRGTFSYNKKDHYLGRHKTEEGAAEAYNEKAEDVLGDNGFRNEIGVGFYKIGAGNNYKMWTEKGDETIKIGYEEGSSLKEIAKKLGRSKSSISVRAYELGHSEKEYHMRSDSRPYRIWGALRARTQNKNNKRYHRYGGRGITTCEKWQRFEGFWEDMEEGYSDELSIGRIDNDKGYYKENCRWETREQQDNNTSRTRWITYRGKTQNLTQWANEIGMEYKTLDGRIMRGWSIKDAITIPVGSVKRYKDEVLNN